MMKAIKFGLVFAALMLAGIAYLASVYGVGATEPGVVGYESMISQLVRALFKVGERLDNLLRFIFRTCKQ